MGKTIPGEKFDLGVCYYPEHWPEQMWTDDYKRMPEIGFTCMGEFAWNFFEPEERVFTFDLFDRAVDIAYRHGLKIILGTPTATPPSWMTNKYPEILNVSENPVKVRLLRETEDMLEGGLLASVYLYIAPYGLIVLSLDYGVGWKVHVDRFRTSPLIFKQTFN